MKKTAIHTLLLTAAVAAPVKQSCAVTPEAFQLTGPKHVVRDPSATLASHATSVTHSATNAHATNGYNARPALGNSNMGESTGENDASNEGGSSGKGKTFVNEKSADESKSTVPEDDGCASIDLSGYVFDENADQGQDGPPPPGFEKFYPPPTPMKYTGIPKNGNTGTGKSNVGNSETVNQAVSEESKIGSGKKSAGEQHSSNTGSGKSGSGKTGSDEGGSSKRDIDKIGQPSLQGKEPRDLLISEEIYFKKYFDFYGDPDAGKDDEPTTTSIDRYPNMSDMPDVSYISSVMHEIAKVTPAMEAHGVDVPGLMDQLGIVTSASTRTPLPTTLPHQGLKARDIPDMEPKSDGQKITTVSGSDGDGDVPPIVVSASLVNDSDEQMSDDNTIGPPAESPSNMIPDTGIEALFGTAPGDSHPGPEDELSMDSTPIINIENITDISNQALPTPKDHSRYFNDDNESERHSDYRHDFANLDSVSHKEHNHHSSNRPEIKIEHMTEVNNNFGHNSDDEHRHHLHVDGSEPEQGENSAGRLSDSHADDEFEKYDRHGHNHHEHNYHEHEQEAALNRLQAKVASLESLIDAPRGGINDPMEANAMIPSETIPTAILQHSEPHLFARKDRAFETSDATPTAHTSAKSLFVRSPSGTDASIAAYKTRMVGTGTQSRYGSPILAAASGSVSGLPTMRNLTRFARDITTPVISPATSTFAALSVLNEAKAEAPFSAMPILDEAEASYYRSSSLASGAATAAAHRRAVSSTELDSASSTDTAIKTVTTTASPTTTTIIETSSPTAKPSQSIVECLHIEGLSTDWCREVQPLGSSTAITSTSSSVSTSSMQIDSTAASASTGSNKRNIFKHFKSNKSTTEAGNANEAKPTEAQTENPEEHKPTEDHQPATEVAKGCNVWGSSHFSSRCRDAKLKASQAKSPGVAQTSGYANDGGQAFATMTPTSAGYVNPNGQMFPTGRPHGGNPLEKLQHGLNSAQALENQANAMTAGVESVNDQAHALASGFKPHNGQAYATQNPESGGYGDSNGRMDTNDYGGDSENNENGGNTNNEQQAYQKRAPVPTTATTFRTMTKKTSASTMTQGDIFPRAELDSRSAHPPESTNDNQGQEANCDNPPCEKKESRALNQDSDDCGKPGKKKCTGGNVPTIQVTEVENGEQKNEVGESRSPDQDRLAPPVPPSKVDCSLPVHWNLPQCKKVVGEDGETRRINCLDQKMKGLPVCKEFLKAQKKILAPSRSKVNCSLSVNWTLPQCKTTVDEDGETKHINCFDPKMRRFQECKKFLKTHKNTKASGVGAKKNFSLAKNNEPKKHPQPGPEGNTVESQGPRRLL